MKLINLILLFILASCSRSIIDTTLKLGTGVPANTVIESSQGLANNPKIMYDFSLSKWRLTTDGINFTDIATSNDGVVDLLSNQSIAGIKTFTGQLVVTSTVNGSHPAPSMLQAEINLITGQEVGDLVFNTNTSELNFWDGSEWAGIGSGGGGIELLTKGALITSDGVTNGEFTCLDNEILVWDAAEAAGVKCVTNNSNIVPLLSNGQLLVGNGVSSSTFSCPQNEILVWDSTGTNGFRCDPLPVITNLTVAKGSLLTGTGSVQTLFNGCADGEIIEWDSFTANGFKCITTPVGGGGGGTGDVLLDFFRHTEDVTHVTNGTDVEFAFIKTYTVTAGARLKLTCSYSYTTVSSFDSNVTTTNICYEGYKRTQVNPNMRFSMEASASNQAYYLNTDFNEINTFFDFFSSKKTIPTDLMGGTDPVSYDVGANTPDDIYSGQEFAGDNTTWCTYAFKDSGTAIAHFRDTDSNGSIALNTELITGSVGVPSGYTFNQIRTKMQMICQVHEVNSTIIDL